MTKEQIKHRVVGALVLLSLGFILWPFFQQPKEELLVTGIIPPKPDLEVSELKVEENGEIKEELVVKESAKVEEDLPKPTSIPKEEQPKAEVKSKINAEDWKIIGETEPPAVVPEQKTTKVVEKPKPQEIITDKLGSWVVQTITYSVSHKSKADTFLKRLQKSGYKAFIEKATVKGKKVLRVRVGPFVEQKLAKSTQKKINKEFAKDKINSFITKIK